MSYRKALLEQLKELESSEKKDKDVSRETPKSKKKKVVVDGTK